MLRLQVVKYVFRQHFLRNFRIENRVNRPKGNVYIIEFVQRSFSWNKDGRFIIDIGVDIGHDSTRPVDWNIALAKFFIITSITDLQNVFQLPILHPIGTQFLYHLTQPTHSAMPSSPSISAMIFSISSRRTASRATISRICAFSCPISMTSRVSSGAT